ncbi:CGNR zinc finger domain-containing protein [Streptomyces stramineus]
MTLAEDLVNTYNIVRNIEKLPEVDGLSALFADHGMSPAAPLTEDDLAAAHRLRPVLREVFDAPDAPTAVTLLNRVLAEHHAVPHYTDHDGSWHLHVASPAASPVDQYAANAAMGLLAVVTTSGTERLHVCVGNRCAEVFVDTSRNQSRRFCSPSSAATAPPPRPTGPAARRGTRRRRRRARQRTEARRAARAVPRVTAPSPAVASANLHNFCPVAAQPPQCFSVCPVMPGALDARVSVYVPRGRGRADICYSIL